MPAIAVAGAALALWLATGVSVDELARYLGYEVAFVVGPGWLVLRAIAPRTRGFAWQLALGWPLGLTLEILAFSLTAALGVRELFLAYPAAVGVPAALVLLRRWDRARDPGRPPLFTPGARWGLAGLCLLAFAYVGLAVFARTPLPGTVDLVQYPGDLVFNVAIAGDALHNWPVANPGVAGEPYPYHYFANLHMAAISQVTGIQLPVIMFRLFALPLIALLTLQVALAARVVTGRVWAGPLAAALLLLVRAIDISVSDSRAFTEYGLDSFAYSPSQLLGVTIFVPALILLWCLLDRRVSERSSPWFAGRGLELWALLAILLAGAGGAKGVILPLMAGGLAVYLLWRRLSVGAVDRPGSAALGLCVAFFAAYLAILYGSAESGLELAPPGTVAQMPVLDRAHAQFPDGLLADAAFWVAAIPIGIAAYLAAPLIGLLWIGRKRGSPLAPSTALALSMLAVGLMAFFLLQGEFYEQNYITTFGLVASFPLAAGGLIRFLESHSSRLDRKWGAFVALAGGWVAAIVALALLADRLWAQAHYVRADLLLYAPVGVAGLLLLLLMLRARRALAARAAVLGVIALLLTAALNAAIDIGPLRVRQLEAGTPLYVAPTYGMQSRELEGMEWIRDHLDQDAVLAVSSDAPVSGRYRPTDLHYPAFTERRTFREGWAYSREAIATEPLAVQLAQKDPFPERRRLERAVYARADREALRTMVERYGVTHVVVSRPDGPVSPCLYRLGRVVYSNGVLDVMEVSGAGGRMRQGRPCEPPRSPQA